MKESKNREKILIRNDHKITVFNSAYCTKTKDNIRHDKNVRKY